MSQFWAEIADKNQTSNQIQFLKKQLIGVGVVLDVACGTGRHSIPLSEAGFEVVGIDVSRRLLKIAKQRNHGVAVVLGDMRFLPFKAEIFEKAISMDTSFGYLPTHDADQQSLVELRRVMHSGGRFFLDVFNLEHLTRRYLHRRFSKRLKLAGLPLLLKLHSIRLLFWAFKWRCYPSFLLLQKRSLHRDSSLLRDLWVVYTKEDGRILTFEHQVRLYDRIQLEKLLIKAEFVVESVFGGYAMQPYSADATRLLMISSACKF